VYRTSSNGSINSGSCAIDSEPHRSSGASTPSATSPSKRGSSKRISANFETIAAVSRGMRHRHLHDQFHGSLSKNRATHPGQIDLCRTVTGRARKNLLTHMEQTLGPLGIHLDLCCEKKCWTSFPQDLPSGRGMHFGPTDHGGSWRSDIPSSGCRPTQSGGVRLHGFRGCGFLQPSPLPPQLPVLLCQPGLRPEA
jgi:hypothetical protein